MATPAKRRRLKLRNASGHPDWLVRGVLRWAMALEEIEPRWLREAWFRGRDAGYFTGHAYHSGRIVCTVPRKCEPEMLIRITAHELYHIRQFNVGMLRSREARSEYARDTERQACAAERRALAAFEGRKEELLAEWRSKAKPPKAKPAKSPLKERNYERNSELLAAWQRKLKLAQTKVKQYRAKVRRYERELEKAGA